VDIITLDSKVSELETGNFEDLSKCPGPESYVFNRALNNHCRMSVAVFDR